MSAQELLEALGCCVLFGSPETAGKGEERSRERERERGGVFPYVFVSRHATLVG